jgi:hypothetical protein
MTSISNHQRLEVNDHAQMAVTSNCLDIFHLIAEIGTDFLAPRE